MPWRRSRSRRGGYVDLLLVKSQGFTLARTKEYQPPTRIDFIELKHFQERRPNVVMSTVQGPAFSVTLPWFPDVRGSARLFLTFQFSPLSVQVLWQCEREIYTMFSSRYFGSNRRAPFGGQLAFVLKMSNFLGWTSWKARENLMVISMSAFVWATKT